MEIEAVWKGRELTRRILRDVFFLAWLRELQAHVCPVPGSDLSANSSFQLWRERALQETFSIQSTLIDDVVVASSLLLSGRGFTDSHGPREVG